MQVASRIWVLWGIVVLVPDETTQGSLPALGPLSPTLTSLVAAWAVSEIIHYGFFATKASCAQSCTFDAVPEFARSSAVGFPPQRQAAPDVCTLALLTF